MRKIHIILIVLVAAWNASPAGNPFRAVFDVLQEETISDGPTTQADPEDTDPRIINLPPPL